MKTHSKTPKYLAGIAVFAVAGVIAVTAISASSAFVSVSSSTPQTTDLSTVSDVTAEGNSYLQFASVPIVCQKVVVGSQSEIVKTFTVTANVPFVRAAVQYGDGFSETLDPKQPAKSYSFKHTYPYVLRDRSVAASITLTDAEGKNSRCVDPQIALKPIPDVAKVAVVNPAPFQGRILRANSIDQITAILNEFMSEFKTYGDAIGHSPRKVTKVVTKNSRIVGDNQYTQLAQSDLNRYKIGANAFMDGVSHFPVTIFNDIGVEEYIIARSIPGAGGFARTESPSGSDLGSPNINSFVAISLNGIANSFTDAGYNTARAIVAHETGHAWDFRYNLTGSGEPMQLAFNANNPSGFNYTGYPEVCDQVPNVTYQNRQYPRGFLRCYGMASIKEDLATIFGFFFADDLGGRSNSEFESVLLRAQPNVDQQLHNKVNVVMSELLKTEPPLTYNFLRAVNYSLGCKGCKLP